MPAKRTTRKSLLWRWRRGLFLTGLLGVAATGGAASLVFRIELPPEEPLLQTSFVCAADVTEACGPDNATATFSAAADRIKRSADLRGGKAGGSKGCTREAPT